MSNQRSHLNSRTFLPCGKMYQGNWATVRALEKTHCNVCPLCKAEIAQSTASPIILEPEKPYKSRNAESDIRAAQKEIEIRHNLLAPE